jgi:hypothetical protein
MVIPDEVKRLARAGIGEKINAIQVLRAATGIGLAYAKQIVETLAAGGEVELPPEPVSNETRDQRVERQLRAICTDGRASVLTSDKIGTLLAILKEDEDVLDLVLAMHGSCEGVLIATQRRLVFIDQALANESTVEEFHLNSVSLVHRKAGLTGDSIRIFMGGCSKAEFTNVEMDVAQSFAECVSKRATGRERFDPADELEHLEWLEALYDSGALGTQEYEDRRRPVLDELRRRKAPGAGAVRRLS